MMMTGLKVAAAAALLTIFSAGTVYAAETKAKDVEIGAILLDTKQEWFAEIIQGMKKAGADLNAKVKILSSDSDVAESPR